MDNQNFDEKKPPEAGAKQAANRPRRGRPPKKAAQTESTPAPQGRSHDILGTPEIFLSAEPSAQPQTGSGDAPTPNNKPRRNRRPGRKPQPHAEKQEGAGEQTGNQNAPLESSAGHCSKKSGNAP
jgi:hypothetical protein